MLIKTNFDYPKIAFSEKSEFNARLVVGLKGDDDFKPLRVPLNITLVLDHSGSMAGGKLENVKEAAINLFYRLAPDDIFSLVLFENKVTPLISPAKVSQQNNAVSVIRNIHSAGMTFFSGGYEKGFQYALKNNNPEYVSRIIILSDGLANVGITSRTQLGEIAAGYLKSGVSTSTIGVGNDYDEDLMVILSENGSGNSYYIENPTDIESVFTEELSYLTDLYAVNTKFTITPAIPGLQLGQLTTFKQHGLNTFEIGDVFASRNVNAIFELGIPPQNGFGTVTVANLNVTYEELSGTDKTPKMVSVPLEVQVVSEKEFNLQQPDESVLKDIAFVLIANSKKEARLQALAGMYDESADTLRVAYDRINCLELKDIEVNYELNNLDNSSRKIKLERENYFDKKMSKEFIHSSENIVKGKKFAYDRHNTRINKMRNPFEYEHYLIIDVNTSSVYWKGMTQLPRLVQIGWILTDKNFREIKSNSLIIRPAGFIIPKDGTKFHGITTEKALTKGVEIGSAIERLEKDISPVLDDINLIAYDSDYIIDIIKNEYNYLMPTGIIPAMPFQLFQFSSPSQSSLREMAKPIVPGQLKKHGEYPRLSEIYRYLFNAPVDTKNDVLKDADVIRLCCEKLSKIMYLKK